MRILVLKLPPATFPGHVPTSPIRTNNPLIEARFTTSDTRSRVTKVEARASMRALVQGTYQIACRVESNRDLRRPCQDRFLTSNALRRDVFSNALPSVKAAISILTFLSTGPMDDLRMIHEDR